MKEGRRRRYEEREDERNRGGGESLPFIVVVLFGYSI